MVGNLLFWAIWRSEIDSVLIEHTIEAMRDLRPLLTIPIAELQRRIGASSYSCLYAQIAGRKRVSLERAQRIAIASEGSITMDDFGTITPQAPTAA